MATRPGANLSYIGKEKKGKLLCFPFLSNKINDHIAVFHGSSDGVFVSTVPFLQTEHQMGTRWDNVSIGIIKASSFTTFPFRGWTTAGVASLRRITRLPGVCAWSQARLTMKSSCPRSPMGRRYIRSYWSQRYGMMTWEPMRPKGPQKPHSFKQLRHFKQMNF